MPNAKDVSLDLAHLKVFVVGDAGTGKSVFASSFPTPAFLFNFDDTILSYRGIDIDYEDYTKDAKGWIKFEKDFAELKKKMDVDDPPYKTIIIDSTTSWSDLAMERALQLDPKRSPTGGPLWNVHYGMVRNLIEGRLRQLLELKANIVVIGHLQIIQDQETGAVVAVQPLLTGQLSTKAPGYFDEVYYTRTKKGKQGMEWVMQTVAMGHYKARSRLSGHARILPDEIPNSYEALLTAIKDGTSKPTTQQTKEKNK